MLYRLLATCSLFACTVSAASCHKTAAGLQPGELPPLAFTLGVEYEEERNGANYPQTVSGHLYLEILSTGEVVGQLSTLHPEFQDCNTPAGPMNDIVGSASGTSIDIGPVASAVCPGGDLVWDTLVLVLEDTDGDGDVDTARGSMAGEWRVFADSSGDTVGVFGPVDAALDRTAPDVRLEPLESYGVVTTELLPTDYIPIGFTEPMREDDVTGALEVLIDEQPIAGEFGYVPYDELILGAAFFPAEPMPFAGAITVRVDELTDPAGNSASADGAELVTVADPGPLDTLPEFDEALTGWLWRGAVEAVDEYAGVAPTGTGTLARVSENATLLGYIDVPDPFVPFDISTTLFTESDELTETQAASLRVHPGRAALSELFNAYYHRNMLEPCLDCDGFSYQLGPVATPIDLSIFAGERVFLQFYIHAPWNFGTNSFERRALLVERLAPAP